MSTETLERPVVSDDGFTLSRIKEGDMAHAMITLSRQYSRPRDAVIRELATNALESHQAAGYTGPVEITLPSSFDPFLTITDHGLGLGLSDITDVIGDYAGSTKRHDEQATPNYGIGSKSPFAVSDSYTVIAVKDGVRREVLFARLSDGNPGYKIISTTSTSEANGVTVRVPVLEPETFEGWLAAAKSVLYWWEKDTFLVHRANFFTGDPETLEIPTYRDDVIDTLSTDNVLSLGLGADASDWEQVVTVRAGTAGYSVPQGFFTELDMPVYGLGNLVVEMPKDSVKVSPNRESIEDTDGNREKIHTALAEWAETVSSTFLTKLDAATSSYNLYRSWDEGSRTEKVLTGLTHFIDPARKYGRDMKIDLRFLKYPKSQNRRKETELDVFDLDEARTSPCLVLEELDNQAAGVIAKWRSVHGKPTVYVFADKEDVRPLIDPDELAWVTLTDLKAETPTKRPVPVSVPLSDTDKVERIWYSRGYRHAPVKYRTSIGDLKKLIADGLPLVIGKSRDYRDLANDRVRSIDYDTVVAIVCPTPALSKRVVNALGQKALTPSEYLYRTYLKEVEGLDDEQKQVLVEQAALPERAVRNAGFLPEITTVDSDGQKIPATQRMFLKS